MKRIFLAFFATAFFSAAFITAQPDNNPSTTRETPEQLADRLEGIPNDTQNLSSSDQTKVRGIANNATTQAEQAKQGLDSNDVRMMTSIANHVVNQVVDDPEKATDINGLINTASGIYDWKQGGDRWSSGAGIAKGVAQLLFEAEKAQKIGGFIDLTIGARLISSCCFSNPVSGKCCATGVMQTLSGLASLKEAEKTKRKRENHGGGEEQGSENRRDTHPSEHPCLQGNYGSDECCRLRPDWTCCGDNPDPLVCNGEYPQQAVCTPGTSAYNSNACCAVAPDDPGCRPTLQELCDPDGRHYNRTECCSQNSDHPICNTIPSQTEVCEPRPFDASRCCPYYHSYICCEQPSDSSCVQNQNTDIDCLNPENARHPQCLTRDSFSSANDDFDISSICDENPNSVTCAEITTELDEFCKLNPTSCPSLDRTTPIVLPNGKTAQPPFDSKSFEDAGFSDQETNAARNGLRNFRRNQIKKNLPEIMDELSELMGESSLTGGGLNSTLTGGGRGLASRGGRLGKGNGNDFSRKLSSLLNRYKKSKENKANAGVSDQAEVKNQIGSAHENIFEMMSRGYSKRNN